MAKTINLKISRYDIPAWLESMGLCRRGIELGTHHGYYSYYFLKHTNIERLWSVDSYTPKWATLYDDAVALLSEFGNRSVIVRKQSLDAAKDFAEQGLNFDFVYLDACHREVWCRKDIEAYLPLIRRPGVICGHDYFVAPLIGVVAAVQDMADKFNVPIYVTRERYASWIVMLGE